MGGEPVSRYNNFRRHRSRCVCCRLLTCMQRHVLCNWRGCLRVLTDFFLFLVKEEKKKQRLKIVRLPNNATDLEIYIVLLLWLIYCFYVIPSLNIHEK